MNELVKMALMVIMCFYFMTAACVLIDINYLHAPEPSSSMFGD